MVNSAPGSVGLASPRPADIRPTSLDETARRKRASKLELGRPCSLALTV
jgi:hypothetical protein